MKKKTPKVLIKSSISQGDLVKLSKFWIESFGFTPILSSWNGSIKSILFDMLPSDIGLVILVEKDEYVNLLIGKRTGWIRKKKIEIISSID